MQAHNSAGWSAVSNTLYFQTQGADTTKPTVNSLSVSPSAVTLSSSFTISYSVSDTGGSGLNRVELWRANDSGGSSIGWAEVKRTSASGNRYSGSFTDAPSSGGTYWYGIHAVDNAGNWAAESSPVRVTVTEADTTADAVPYNLVVRTKGEPAQTQWGIGVYHHLTWDYDFDNAKGFVIQERFVAKSLIYLNFGGIHWPYPIGFREVARGGPDMRAYKTATPIPDIGSVHNKEYRVAAILADGRLLKWSNIAEISPSAMSPPSNFEATVTKAPLQVKLTWEDMSDNEIGFLIYRWKGIGTGPWIESQDSEWPLLTTIDINVQTFIDTDVSPGYTYRYFIQSFNEVDLSLPSYVVMVYIPVSLQTPSAPVPYFQTQPPPTPSPAPLLDRISFGEGTTDAAAKKHSLASAYDITYAYGKYNPKDSKPLTEMTIGEVKQLQKQMLANQAGSSAVGKYQLLMATLEAQQKILGLSDDTKFDAATQELFGQSLLEERGYSEWIEGKITDHDFQKNLAKEWASVADPDTKESRYGQPLGTTDEQIKEAMAQIDRTKSDQSATKKEEFPLDNTANALSTEPVIQSQQIQTSVSAEGLNPIDLVLKFFFSIFTQPQKQQSSVSAATIPALSTTAPSTDTASYTRSSPVTYYRPPGKPYPISPGNDYEPGEKVYTRTPTLTWKPVDQAEYYSLAIRKSPYGSDNIVYSQQQISGTSLTVPDNILVVGEKYRWNMYAYNSAGKSEVSWTLYFKVKQ